MRHATLPKSLVAAGALTLAGCTSVSVGTSRDFQSKSATNVTSPATLGELGMMDQEITAALDTSKGLEAMENQYYNASGADAEATRKRLREEIINLELKIANGLYDQWSQRYYGRAAVITASLDTVTPALSAAATIVAGTAAKVLSALSTASSSANTAIQKDIYQQQGIVAIIAAGDAERGSIRSIIMLGLQTSTDKYTLAQAQCDVGSYIHAGSLVGAIEAAQKASGSAKAATQAAAKTKIQGDIDAANAAVPTITTQPTDFPSAVAGTAVNLAVTATAPAGTTLSYQWYVNGTALNGATQNPYSFTPTSKGTTYKYLVVVSSSPTASVISDSHTITTGP